MALPPELVCIIGRAAETLVTCEKSCDNADHNSGVCVCIFSAAWSVSMYRAGVHDLMYMQAELNRSELNGICACQ